MARIRSLNDIVLNKLDFLRVAQPNLDTKPGTVARDLFIDAPSAQLAKLYEQLSSIAALQSLRLAIGSDLDQLASNYGATRERGSKASGIALLTFSSLVGNVSINKGDIITSNTGATFSVVNSVIVNSLYSNTFRAVASKYKAALDFVGITDQYAVEVNVECTAQGQIGNISRYQLKSASIAGVSNVTNPSPFGGGSPPEDDAAFRSRILAIFSGSNTGTALGYKNAVLSDPAVIDAIVIGPGSTLMTRDGTQVVTNEDGTKTIVSEGSGGKVDVQIFGSRIQQIIDTYIYKDKSNKNDPTDPVNNYVLGQIIDDAGKTVARKRIDDIANKTLPSQPVNNIINVSGTISGPNFAPKVVDSLGRVSGNYELIRDTGAYGGSPWGFDQLHWISNQITNYLEDKNKISFNGQDPLSYTDVLKIPLIQQNILVTNENSVVSPTDRSSIQLVHYPCSNVTRVFNLTTGERYVITNQNPDGTGSVNNSGRITISGNSLPAVSDILQVDYTWILNYDQYFDYFNKDNSLSSVRTVADSIDWGFSNNVRREEEIVSITGSLKIVNVQHPVSAVSSVNIFNTANSSVFLSSNLLAINVPNLVTNVISVKRNSDGAELYDTKTSDGTFNNYTIFLPTDTIGKFGDAVSVTYNAVDVFNINNISGSFSNNQITLPDAASAYVSSGTIVECNYIANVSNILPSTNLSSLPAIKNLNAFNTVTNTSIGCQPITNIYGLINTLNDGYQPTILNNLRLAPSRLGLSIAGQVSNGTITVTGNTFNGIFESIYTVASNSLEQNLASSIKSFLNLKTIDEVPSNVRVIKIAKIEKVTTTNDLQVLSVDFNYDVKGYELKSNDYTKFEAIQNNLLSSTQFKLPSTTNNLNNIPQIGDRLRVSFYIETINDFENVSFSRDGTLYTNKIFSIVNSIAISSGFTSGSSLSATLTVTNLNQPVTSSRYKAYYNYLAPKTNERITINYNYNKAITDATFNIEDVRPINADVLAKAAVPILVNATLNVVISQDFTYNSTVIQQNLQSTITNTLNAQQLGTTLDSSDLINAAYTVQGVDRVRVMYFNKNGVAGSVLSIVAQQNEYILANQVIINIETR